MILQINEIDENELNNLVVDSNHKYYIGKSKEGLRSAIINVNSINEKLIRDIIDLLMSNKT